LRQIKSTGWEDMLNTSRLPTYIPIEEAAERYGVHRRENPFG